jgi:hypothetical protein
MPPRRKTHLPLMDELEEDYIGIEYEGHPIASGTENEDLICGRCHTTLFLGLSRNGIFEYLAKESPPKRPRAGHARQQFPLAAICDCGAVNRVWPAGSY